MSSLPSNSQNALSVAETVVCAASRYRQQWPHCLHLNPFGGIRQSLYVVLFFDLSSHRIVPTSISQKRPGYQLGNPTRRKEFLAKFRPHLQANPRRRPRSRSPLRVSINGVSPPFRLSTPSSANQKQFLHTLSCREKTAGRCLIQNNDRIDERNSREFLRKAFTCP